MEKKLKMQTLKQMVKSMKKKELQEYCFGLHERIERLEAKQPKRASIAELEKILTGEKGADLEILPSGEIREKATY
jgi:hypothetical protein